MLLLQKAPSAGRNHDPIITPFKYIESVSIFLALENIENTQLTCPYVSREMVCSGE